MNPLHRSTINPLQSGGPSSDTPTTVFISSTFLDNEERRKLVEDANLRAGMRPVGMERFTASANPTVEECKRQARECEVYLGIIAHRYGWIPNGLEVSITELEYDAAKAAGRFRLMFEIAASVPFIKTDLDQGEDCWDKQKKLDNFKAKYRADQMPAPFEENKLSGMVVQALHDWRKKKQGGNTAPATAEAKMGFHGATDIALIDAFREAHARKRHNLIILGDPGSGKTTHLKRLLLACLRQGPDWLGLPDDILPVFLPLRELEDLDHGIDAFIEKTLDSPHLNMPKGFGKRLLERGRLLLLFDGLDEVSDSKQRAKVARWIESAAQALPACTAIVTCRFAGYNEDSRLDAGFLELHLRPMTQEPPVSG